MTPELSPSAAPVTSPAPAAPAPAELRRQRLITAGAIAAVVVLVAIIALITYALGTHPAAAETVRDIAIIFAAVVMVLIMLALMVLVIQLARLTTLLQHEIKPILDSTNETVSTLRGTAEFLSNHMVEPVVKLNSYAAGMQRLLELLRIVR